MEYPPERSAMPCRNLIDKIGSGRMLVAASLGLALVVLYGLVVVPGVAGWKVLHLAGVPALEIPFMDLRGVATWCDAAAEGVDPARVQTTIRLSDGSMHPNFLMNYPPVVLSLRHVGLSASSVVMLAGVLAGLYFAAALYLVGRIDLPAGCVWSFLLVSPLSLLVVERANLDILVFALFAAALALRRHPALAAGMVLLSGVLKLYPAAGLAAVGLRAGRAGRFFAVLGVLLFVGYLVFLLPRLAAIGGSLADQSKSCFGADVVCDVLISHGVLDAATGRPVSMALQSLAALGSLLALVSGFYFSAPSKIQAVSARAVFAFWLSAPMMIALFLLSNQMDYKWTFHLFMVPAALELAGGVAGAERKSARAWLLLLGIYSYWTFFSGEESLRNAIWKQGVMWLVFLASSGLAGMFLRGVFSQKGFQRGPESRDFEC